MEATGATGDKGWDGVDRRADFRRESDSLRGTPLGELYYRIDSSEKKIDKIEEKVDVLTIGYTTLKIEMTNIAKDEGKLSGIIYGIGGAVFTAILIKLIENGLGG
jgi:tetrahydromethanopterin S-methyltransferase subunit G